MLFPITVTVYFQLTIAYAPYIVPKEFRREKLRADYYFDCQCERCLDEEEDLLERSGKATCCPDGAVLPRKTSWFYCFKQPLVCNQCGKESPLTVEQVCFLLFKEIQSVKKI